MAGNIQNLFCRDILEHVPNLEVAWISAHVTEPNVGHHFADCKVNLYFLEIYDSGNLEGISHDHTQPVREFDEQLICLTA